jgi:RNA-directed DNA polymerase
VRFVPTPFSPLLANIVLHGLEDVGHKLRYKTRNGEKWKDALSGFRYADDVVFILKPEDDENALRGHIDEFLAIRGLKVKEWGFLHKPSKRGNKQIYIL